jgi:homoserine kinase
MPDRLLVSAPASSANLGPGFDCLAVALELRNQVEIRRVGGDGLALRMSGEGADEAPDDRENLFVRAFEAGGGTASGIEVTMTNRIPFARGLGSSAATITAGLVAAAAWAGRDPAGLLAPATSLEGHPDNVSAALKGGVTLAWTVSGEPSAVGLGSPRFGLAVVVPNARVATRAARAALPASVPFADAVHTASRAALLVAALQSGDGALLAEALDDRLHEPYRARLAPLLRIVRDRLPAVPGAVGATLSGAGPSVLVWCEWGHEADVAEHLGDLPGADAMALAVASQGARVEAEG